jgi:hypothetical protein
MQVRFGDHSRTRPQAINLDRLMAERDGDADEVSLEVRIGATASRVVAAESLAVAGTSRP